MNVLNLWFLFTFELCMSMKKEEKGAVVQRIVQAYLSSVISITLLLFLVGLAGFLGLNAHQLNTYFKENMALSVVLREGIATTDALEAKKMMQALPFVKEATYISQEQGSEEMAALLGADFLDMFDYNPLPVSVELKLKAEYVQEDALTGIEDRLLEMRDVREVVYQKSVMALVSRNLERIGLALLIFIGLLLFVSVVLVNNTIRLSVYARRFTIYTMCLVGATKGFIRRPFVWQAFFQGLISGLLAVFLLIVLLSLVQKEWGDVYNFIDDRVLLIMFGGMALLGVMICMLSTRFVVNKMVRMDSGDLYY